MASNKELATAASDLGAKMGVEVKTDGLNNDKLASLVNDLQGKYDKAKSAVDADKAAEAEARAKSIEKAAGDSAARAKKELADQEKDEAEARKQAVADAEAKQKLADELNEHVVAKGHTVQCGMGELSPGKRLRGGAMDRVAFETHKKNGALVKKAKPKADKK